MYFFFPQESDETGTDSDSSDSDEIGMDEPDQRVEMPSGSGGGFKAYEIFGSSIACTTGWVKPLVVRSSQSSWGWASIDPSFFRAKACNCCGEGQASWRRLLGI